MSSPSEFSIQDITGVILAGGASSRMGRDKALLEWRGRPFIAHIAAQLGSQLRYVCINTNSPTDFTQFNLPIVRDATAERRGPLAGILAALAHATTSLTLIVPCDNPRISPQLVQRLLNALNRNACDIGYATVNGDNSYLYALLRTRLRDDLEKFLQGDDYAVRRWYETQSVTRVDFSDQPEYFRNINSHEDFSNLPAN